MSDIRLIKEVCLSGSSAEKDGSSATYSYSGSMAISGSIVKKAEGEKDK